MLLENRVQGGAMRRKLSIQDVQRLMAHPSGAARAEVAEKVAQQFENIDLSPRERELAREVLGYLVHDVAINVREALSDSLKDMPGAPRGIVLELARDLDEVAIPVLRNSPVLSDEDLVGLVTYGSPAKQCAIASRQSVNSSVSEAIVSQGDRIAVLTLVANEGAIIDEAAAGMLAERYPDDREVVEPVVTRSDVPPLLIEKLISQVSESLRDYLVNNHSLDTRTAGILEAQARERSTAEAATRMSDADLRRLVDQLAENQRLTGSLILRLGCQGEMRFVEASMARLTDVPEVRIWRLIHDVGALGFRAVYARAGMPEALYPAFRVMLDAFHREKAVSSFDLARYRATVVKGLLSSYDTLQGGDFEALMDQLGRLSGTGLNTTEPLKASAGAA